MMFGHLLTNGKTNPAARVLFHRVQTSERHKNLVHVPFVNADAVILKLEDPVASLAAGGYVNFRGVVATKFNGIGNEILKKLDELGLLAKQGRQGIMRDRRSALGDGKLQVLQDDAHHRLTIDRPEWVSGF